MDDVVFDRLTRRFVLAGLTGGSLATILLDEAEAKKRNGSKRKRCRQKKRKFCAGRCCPQGRRCENRACVGACVDPFTCPDAGGFACANNIACFCSTSVTGAAACVAVGDSASCLDKTSCNSNDACPVGQICGSCFCSGSAIDFRCFSPCPTG